MVRYIFINPEEHYPVIATTSELITTGVDAQTCKIIVLDSEIKSMTKFKQVVGRETRINEEFGKMFFTILDFRNVTDLFADTEFDGDQIRVKLLINFGSPMEIIEQFGSKVKYSEAIKELEQELYKTCA